MALCVIEALAGSAGSNNAQMKSIVAKSKKLSGTYYIQNVGTKKWLYYTNKPQTIIPSSSRSSILLRSFEVGVQVKPTASNNKCLAAQWNSSLGADWAGTMYACRDSGSKNHDIGDVQRKQQWHFYPVAGRSSTYYILPDDHLDDMAARALTSKALNTAGGYKSTGIAGWNLKDTKQMWHLTKG